MSGKATFSSLKSNVQKGGNDEEYYRYKARKYHYKCQTKLKEMQSQGKSVPSGYEKYLGPFEG